MVVSTEPKRVGFIVEGGSEKVIIESSAFRRFLSHNGCELVTPVIDAKGGGNLLPQNIEVFVEQLSRKSVDAIYVLTDLEDEASVDVVRERIAHEAITFSFIAVKALEAWYLADTTAMNKWLNSTSFYEEYPERTIDKPWDRLKQVAVENGQRGPGQKISFAKRISTRWQFSIEGAASHDNCPSALELTSHFEEK